MCASREKEGRRSFVHSEALPAFSERRRASNRREDAARRRHFLATSIPRLSLFGSTSSKDARLLPTGECGARLTHAHAYAHAHAQGPPCGPWQARLSLLPAGTTCTSATNLPAFSLHAAAPRTARALASPLHLATRIYPLRQPPLSNRGNDDQPLEPPPLSPYRRLVLRMSPVPYRIRATHPRRALSSSEISPVDFCFSFFLLLRVFNPFRFLFLAYPPRPPFSSRTFFFFLLPLFFNRLGYSQR